MTSRFGAASSSSWCRQGWARQQGGEEETSLLQIPNFPGSPGALQVPLGPRAPSSSRRVAGHHHLVTMEVRGEQGCASPCLSTPAWAVKS